MKPNHGIKRIGVAAGAAVILELGLAMAAQAEDKTFTGTTPANWFDPNIWTPAGVPVDGQSVNLEIGNVDYQIDINNAASPGSGVYLPNSALRIGRGIYYDSSGADDGITAASIAFNGAGGAATVVNVPVTTPTVTCDRHGAIFNRPTTIGQVLYGGQHQIKGEWNVSPTAPLTLLRLAATDGVGTTDRDDNVKINANLTTVNFTQIWGDLTVKAGVTFTVAGNYEKAFRTSGNVPYAVNSQLFLNGAMRAAAMSFDGVDQGTGTWGAIGSGAANQVSWIIGAGILTVLPLPGSEIAVEQPLSTDIPNNGTKDFRWVSVGAYTDRVFTIKNTGTADLTGLTITKDGANQANFTVTSYPTAPVPGPTGTTTFTVRFAPSAPGLRTAAIHIANNDSNENPFHINLKGTGTTATPPIHGALRIFLLTGQSNMEGQAYTYDSTATAGWNVPTIQFLLSGTPAATTYVANMPYSFKSSLSSGWLASRSDVWGVHYNSGNGTVKNILPTNNQAGILSGIQPMQPGFGVGTSNGSMFGPELSMGIRLGDASDDPVFLFKSDLGGTTLGNDWRPTAAVTARGGAVGINYTNTVNKFRAFLDTLDADLAADGKLNAYNNATSYKVSGLVWFQGWNEQYDDAPYTAAQLQAEYKDNLKDLVHSIRACDARIPGDLPLIIPESSDQNASLDASRLAAVAELNAETANTAVYIENKNMIGTYWGNNELGVPFSTDWGYHFNVRAENYLEIGWRIGGAVLASGFIKSNSETVAQWLTGPGGPFEGQNDPAKVGFAANPDGDPWVNAIEVLFGLNPAAADGAIPVTTGFVNVGGTTYLEVRVNVDAAMDDLIAWHLEFSSDLVNWAESSNPRVVVGQGGGMRSVTIRDSQAAGTTLGRFCRVKVRAGE